MKEIIFILCVFLFLYFIYRIGYKVGKEDCLIIIENKVEKIRRINKELGDSWKNYYSETALLEVHEEIKK